MTSEFKLEVGEYETVNGRTVNIVFVDENSAFGYMCLDSVRHAWHWRIDGVCESAVYYNIKPPKPKPLVRWVNVYSDSIVAHTTKEGADRLAGDGRLSRIRLELPIGQFDEEIS